MGFTRFSEGWNPLDFFELDEDGGISLPDDYLGSPDYWLNIDDEDDPEDEGQPSK